jgi:hypothetical protein
MTDEKTIEYRPAGIWRSHDFSVNKHYWRKIGIASAESIRTQNLLDAAQVLSAHGVGHWLQGQTLQGIFQNGELLDDHDDDFGVWHEDRDRILSEVKTDLEAAGFRLIRDTVDIVSFERDFRYLDICFFRSYSKNIAGYGQKRFEKPHFLTRDEISWKGGTFGVPSDTQRLLDAMYPTTLYWKVIQSMREKRASRRLRRLVKSILVVTTRKLPDLLHLPRPFPSIAKLGAVVLGGQLKTLSEEEFLNLLVEPEDSFNWIWRVRHLNPVTCNGRYRRVGEILEYLQSDSVRKAIEANMEETDTSQPFFHPTNLDMRFWWSGENYFYYCVKYGFRKGVQPYSKVNDYIESGKKPLLYTKEYYDSLPILDGPALAEFLNTTPIEVENGAIVGGKHRVFAMIGRMINGEDYIPMLQQTSRF